MRRAGAGTSALQDEVHLGEQIARQLVQPRGPLRWPSRTGLREGRQQPPEYPRFEHGIPGTDLAYRLDQLGGLHGLQQESRSARTQRAVDVLVDVERRQDEDLAHLVADQLTGGLDPVGAGATTLRTKTAQQIVDKTEIAVVRGNVAEVATLAGRAAEIRGVEAIGAEGSGAELAQAAARALGTVAAVTGPVDHVSDGDRVIAVSNGHELLSTVTGTGCMATAVTGCFLAVRPDAPLEAAAEALVAFGLAGEDAAEGAKGPGTFHVRLYDALYDLNPETIDGRARVDEMSHI